MTEILKIKTADNSIYRFVVEEIEKINEAVPRENYCGGVWITTKKSGKNPYKLNVPYSDFSDFFMNKLDASPEEHCVAYDASRFSIDRETGEFIEVI